MHDISMCGSTEQERVQTTGWTAFKHVKVSRATYILNDVADWRV